MEKAPFRYDIVGSFLRPERLKKAREDYFNQHITKEELTVIENEEIKKLIDKQKSMGLKAVTDGEFRRRWWHLDFIQALNGITVYDKVTTGFQGKEMNVQGSFISSPISFNEHHPFLEHFHITQEIAEDALVKQTIPGPNMIYLDSLILSPQYKEHPVYVDIADFKKDLIETYQRAILAFYEAGCRYLQLDDTSWGALFSSVFRERIEACGFDPDQLIKEFGDITEAALEVKPSDMVITFHICKGNFQSSWLYEGFYDIIAERLFSIDAFDGFFLEYDDERSGDFSPLKYIRHQKVVLGLITTKTAELEDKETIKNRILEASQYLPLEQLCLSPQCGFASTQEGNHITLQQQWAKLEHVITIAKEIFE